MAEFNKNHLGHDLSNDLSKNPITFMWADYICIKCGSIFFYTDNEYFIVGDTIVSNLEMATLTCEETIIKNIIE